MQGLRPASGVICAALQQLHGRVSGNCFCFFGHPVWPHSTAVVHRQAHCLQHHAH